MHAILALLNHAPLARGQDRRLPSHIAQLADDLLVAIGEAVQAVRNLDVVAKLHDQALGAAQVVAGDARVEVVDGLELQAAVEEVEPLGAVDVHGGAQHLLGEALVLAQVGGAHGEMRQRDLHVHGHRHDVADHDEGEAVPPRWDRLVHRHVREPVPEENLAGNLQPHVPPRRTTARRLAAEEVHPAQPVQVEAAEAKYGVVEHILEPEEELGGGIILQHLVVIRGPEGFKETVGNGKKRQVLDIRVMLNVVRDNVVNVMVTLPPA